MRFGGFATTSREECWLAVLFATLVRGTTSAYSETIASITLLPQAPS